MVKEQCEMNEPTEMCKPLPDMFEHLIAFRDGSYKKIVIERDAWKHSQWIHYTRPGGSVVMVNPANVNYIERRIV